MSKYFTLLYIFIFLLSAVPLVVGAQNGSTSVYGSVKDEFGEPLPQLVVKVLHPKDSTLVKGATSSMQGRFRVAGLPFGSYIVQFSYVGYKTLTENVRLTPDAPSANMGQVEMQPTDILLSEAVIIGKAPEVVVKEDTLEFNADSYKPQASAVVEDLIKNMPGVEVDESGRITVNGKQITKILVDGEEFFSDDPKVASKNLPASMVDKLQVIDRQSDEARFSGVDDGEDETVINLTVKKGMKNGWFGNFQAGGGTDGRFEANLMANRFIDKNQFSIIASANNVNNMGAGDYGATMFSGSSRRARSSGNNNSGINTSSVAGFNFNINQNEKFKAGGDIKYAFSHLDLYERSDRQDFLAIDSTSYDNSIKDNLNKSHNVEMNFRFDWTPDEFTRVEFHPRFKYNHSDMASSSASLSYGLNTVDPMAVADTITVGSLDSYSRGDGVDISGHLRMSRLFRSKQGRRISFSLNYGYNDSREDGYSYNRTEYFKTETIEQLDLKDDNHSWGGNVGIRASYIEPINKHTSWSLTYDYRISFTYADKLSYNIAPDGTIGSINEDYSNSFRNTFQRHKVSTAISGKYDKMRYNVGMDFEPSKSESRNLIDAARDVEGKMQYNFSPFLRYRYKMSETRSLRIDYNGRTQQPSVSQLQPSQSISDPLRRTEGNPNLKASYDNSLRLRYNNYDSKTQRAVMTVLNASYVINGIINTTEYTDEGIQITRPVNESGDWNVSAMNLLNMPFKNRKFAFNTFTRLSYQNQIGFLNNEKNISKTLGITERLGFTFRSDYIDLGLRANGKYSRTKNTMQSSNDQNVFDYGGTFNTTLYIPGDLTLTSDVTYTATAGYSEGYDKQYWVWNAQLSWQFLKNKQASLIVRAYDLLNQNNNIRRTVTGTYIQDVETNSLGRYVMFSFAYRFNTIGGRGSTTLPDMPAGHGPRGGFGGPPPPPGHF